MDEKRVKLKIKFVDWAIGVILLIALIYSAISYDSLQDVITNEIGVYGYIAIFLIILFLELIPQIISPIFVLLTSLLAGMNVYLIVLIAIIASLFGSLLGFYLGKSYGEKYLRFFSNEKTLNKVSRFWDKYGKVFVTISALTPLPFVPFVFGSIKMKWKDFLVYGIIPRTLNFIIYASPFY